MGGAASKPADIASLASSAVDYQPPLGPPNPVSLLLPVIRWLCKDSFTAPCLSPFLWHTNAPHSYSVMSCIVRSALHQIARIVSCALQLPCRGNC